MSHGVYFADLIENECNLHGGEICNVAEIGVKKGRTSHHLLQNPDVNLWMVDAWRPLPGYDRWGSSIHSDHYDEAEESTQFAAGRRTLYIGTSEQAAQSIQEDFHLVILDSDHSEKHVKRDLLLWSAKLAEDGIIAGRFYGEIDGVTAAVDWFMESQPYTAAELFYNPEEGHGWWIRIMK
jgi:hypothetical protein